MTGCGPHCGHHNDMIELERLCAELDKSNTAYLHLHDLVNAWADAEDHRDHIWRAGYKRNDKDVRDAELRIDETLTALRKAVGR